MCHQEKILSYEMNYLWEKYIGTKRANTWLPKRCGPGNNQENIKNMLHSRSCIQLMIKQSQVWWNAEKKVNSLLIIFILFRHVAFWVKTNTCRVMWSVVLSITRGKTSILCVKQQDLNSSFFWNKFCIANEMRQVRIGARRQKYTRIFFFCARFIGQK